MNQIPAGVEVSLAPLEYTSPLELVSQLEEALDQSHRMIRYLAEQLILESVKSPDDFVWEAYQATKEVSDGPLLDKATKPYMVREDGTRKGATGFYGTLKTPGGQIMSELSIGTPGDPDEPFGPSLAPGLTREHVDYLTGTPGRYLSTTRPDLWNEITRNAEAFARTRAALGRSPFMEAGKDLFATPISRQEFDQRNLLKRIQGAPRGGLRGLP